MTTSGPRAATLAAFYFAYFMTIGVTQPYLSGYLKGLGLSATEIGALLAVSPLLAMVAPVFWGYVADRTGRPDKVLTALALGALASFLPLTVTEQFAPLLLALAAYAFFTTSVTPMIDSLTLRHVRRTGGAYARLRLFGSLGFIVSAFVFGLVVTRLDRAVVWAVVFLIAGYLLVSLRVRDPSAKPLERLHPLAGLALLRFPALRLLLASTALHWIAGAPFHAFFAVHATALGHGPWVVGLSASLGVAAEVAVMLLYPSFEARFSPRWVLVVAFAASVARWLGMALLDQAWPLIGLSLLHGLSFGAFYVAAIAQVSRLVPDALRVSGQALFVACTFGLGGVIGFAASGVLYDSVGGHRLYGVAAGVESLAVILALWLAVRGPRE